MGRLHGGGVERTGRRVKLLELSYGLGPATRAIPDRRESLRDSNLLEKLLFLYIPEHFHIGNALGVRDHGGSEIKTA